MKAHLFTRWLIEYFKPVKTYNSEEKNIIFETLLLLDYPPGHPWALMEMYKIKIVFMPANMASILQPMDQGVIMTSKFY